MKKIIILFICFVCSLGIVMHKDNSDVLEGYEESIYVFKEYTENDENVINPETDDLELRANIVIMFYSLLFSLMFYIKMKMSTRYIIYNE
jgi:hypothetical protein